MKKGLLLIMVILLGAFVVQSFAVQKDTRPVSPIEDSGKAAGEGTFMVNVPGQYKAVTTTVVDTIQNIRTLLSVSARNMACSPGATSADDTVQIAYLKGTGATYALHHACSFDGGATWSSVLVDNVSRPRYPAAVVDDNDEGAGVFRPMHIGYHRQTSAAGRSEVFYAREDGSVGDGLWSVGTKLSDQTLSTLWIPALNRSGNFLAMAAFDNGTLGTSWCTYSEDRGDTWVPNPMAQYPVLGSYAVSPVLLPLANPDSIFAFTGIDLAVDPSGATAQPTWWLSTDRGATYAGPYPVVPGTTMPQFMGAIWWYHYDAILVNNVPHLTWAINDYEGPWAGPNGSVIFHATLKVPGDYTQGWKITKVSDVEDPITGLGSLPGNPSIGADASGNIYISYCDWSMSTANTGIRIVVSTDGGDNWSMPYVIVPPDAAYDVYPQEMAREVGTAAHVISCDGIQTPDAGGLGPLYHYLVPISDIMSTGIAPKVTTPAIYTEGLPMGTGDTTITPSGDSLYFSWTTGFGYGGEYEIWVTQDSTWAGQKYYWPNIADNEFIAVGMPEAGGHWFWKVRAIMGSDISDWSSEYSFTFGGSAIDSGWVNGVAGKPPVTSVPQPFVLNQNRPNPVSGDTKISFNLPKAGEYSLKVYNVAGQVVSAINGRGQAGNNTVNWNSRAVSNGVYFYQLNAAGSTATKKMIVVK